MLSPWLEKFSPLRKLMNMVSLGCVSLGWTKQKESATRIPSLWNLMKWS